MVLNGNKLDWSGVLELTARMDKLEELHLSTNCLRDINNNTFKVSRVVSPSEVLGRGTEHKLGE